ncbi:MAG: hypothetical protein WA131_01735 [Desulfitobacteriaceae bacterium]
MKYNKIVFMLSLFIILTLVGCSSNSKNTSEGLPVKHISSSSAIDVNNPRAVVGAVDYVFVGHIDNLVGTIYKFPSKLNSKEFSMPYTNYSITVIDNIKGKLKKDVSIPIQQNGGVSKDGSEYILHENDKLLEVNKYYILTAYTQPDGSLLISGPNSSTLLDEKSKSEIMSSQTYKDYNDAYRNEIKMDRERFTSKYSD